MWACFSGKPKRTGGWLFSNLWACQYSSFLLLLFCACRYFKHTHIYIGATNVNGFYFCIWNEVLRYKNEKKKKVINDWFPMLRLRESRKWRKFDRPISHIVSYRTKSTCPRHTSHIPATLQFPSPGKAGMEFCFVLSLISLLQGSFQ